MFLPRSDSKLALETALWEQGFDYAVAGIDEAGRGCCAGPVVAAAVVFTDPGRIPQGVDDSKKLSHSQRMALRELLLAEKSVIWAVGRVSPEEIDSSDILRSTWKAMRLALDGVRIHARYALVDGNPVQGLGMEYANIVKGDARSASIAAASIIAKTTRDMEILEAAGIYPQYEFELHKGYCTARHTELIRKFGPCPIHRRTFEPVKSILNPPELEQGFLF